MAQPINRLKIIALYRLSTSLLINYHCNEKNEEGVKKESEKVALQIKSIGLQSGERQRINTSSGCWNCMLDDKGVLYIILTGTLKKQNKNYINKDQKYPERHAYAIVTQIEQELLQSGDYSKHDDLIIKAATRNLLKDLALKYNDLESVDKIYLAQQQVNETQNVMEDNVKKMLKNQQDLNQLSNKADQMNTNAQGFYKNSNELASIMYWRNMKLKIMIVLIILAGLCYILVPIIITVSSKDS